MSNSKYDWEPYKPRMIQLYLNERKICDIHATIQDPESGFEPRPRRVYDILNEWGYPTKPKERKLFMQQYRSTAGHTFSGPELHSIGITDMMSNFQSKDNISEPSHMALSPSLNSSFAIPQQPDVLPTTDDNSRDNGRNENDEIQRYSSMTNYPEVGQDTDQNESWEWFLNEDGLALFDDVSTNIDNHVDYSATRVQARVDAPIPTLFGQQQGEDSTAYDSVPDTESVVVGPTRTSHDAGPNAFAFESPASTTNSLIQPKSTSSYRCPSLEAKKHADHDGNLSSRITAMLPTRFRPRSSSPSQRASTLNRDSGYISGRNSPFPSIEEEPCNEQLPMEFKDLYRVPCSHQEPQPPGMLSAFSSYARQSKDHHQYKNVATCHNCLYTSIHNLSWSSIYLKLEVFQAELRLDSLYDIKALDVVGNSALHYAAAGGANSEYFVSLMHSGVSPYQLNTGGQLFLHCLRPNETVGSASLDLLSINLVNTLNHLNYLDPNGTLACLRWRDNDGRTFLDALASRIPDAAKKEQLFQLIQDAGYKLELSKQYPEPSSQSPSGDGFSATQEKQQKAYEILGRALWHQPNYVDPETGDNVLHALARLKLPEKNSLLSNVRDFVSKDVDLNLHNRDHHSPLAAFIQERPFLGIENDETGATMSKYLDALLWKDLRQRIPSKINVNMRNREGVPALYYAAVRARPDSVRSLIDAGAHVNARIHDGSSMSILQATLNARSRYVEDKVKMHLFKEVISYLEHEGAMAEPSILKEKGLCTNSVTLMPL